MATEIKIGETYTANHVKRPETTRVRIDSEAISKRQKGHYGTAIQPAATDDHSEMTIIKSAEMNLRSRTPGSEPIAKEVASFGCPRMPGARRLDGTPKTDEFDAHVENRGQGGCG